MATSACIVGSVLSTCTEHSLLTWCSQAHSPVSYYHCSAHIDPWCITLYLALALLGPHSDSIVSMYAHLPSQHSVCAPNQRPCEDAVRNQLYPASVMNRSPMHPWETLIMACWRDVVPTTTPRPTTTAAPTTTPGARHTMPCIKAPKRPHAGIAGCVLLNTCHSSPQALAL